MLYDTSSLIFLSTLSLRRATDYEQYCIHAREISIHALLAESDHLKNKFSVLGSVFLSTLSLRRATLSGLRHKCAIFYFYPRSPCGERRPPAPPRREFYKISIHALLAESDCCSCTAHNRQSQFLSTLSLRRATARKNSGCPYLPISIHALLAESDHPRFFGTAPHIYFYPRSPCGERR